MTDSFWGNYTQGLGAISGVGQQLTARQAGGQLAAGSAGAAASTLYRAGNLAGAQEIQASAATQRAASRAEQLALTKQVIDAARAERDAGRDVGAALNSYRGAFEALGTSAADFDAIASQVIANPALIEQFDAITQQELAWELRAGGNGDTIAVRAPDRYGNTQSRVAYAAPRDPIVTPNAVITPPDRGLAAGQAPLPNQAAPMAGPTIGAGPMYQPTAPAAASVAAPTAALPAAMVGITAQAESGNRERDARGNLITSPAGAQGRMQVMPTTNTDPGYGVRPARDNSDAERTRVGEEYLSAMMREYGGDPAKAWAAYNWGPGNLDRAIDRYGGDWLNYAPAETQNYVANNLRALNGQGGEFAQGDDGQDPLVTNVPRVEMTSDGYRIERFTSPADERAAQAEIRAERAERRAQQSFERQNTPVSRLTPEEARAEGFPPGAVIERRADNSLNVVFRGGDERYTEAQRNAAYFTYRLQNASRTLESLRQQGIERPTPAVLAFADGQIRENALSSEDRRWLQAAREWLAPILRKDTGAAITLPEVVYYMGTYLANPTDDRATLEQKAQAQRAAEEALAGLAGGALEQIYPAATRPDAQGRASSPVRNVPAPLWQTSSEGQRAYWQANPPRGARGSATNPLRLNPADPTVSYGNVRAGQYYLDPNGVRRQRR
jgi:hypothetical protein